MANFATYFACAYVIFLGIPISGLKDVEILVPSYIRQGDDVIFRCNFDLENDNLYAVKWYKGSEEFYRFVPKEVPPQQVFPLSRGGVGVDVKFSNENEALLRNLTLRHSGLFKCAVSAEATFQTVEKSKNITIVGVGYETPLLTLNKAIYHPGESVRANCSLEKTYPLPNVSWYINDNQVTGPVARWVDSKFENFLKPGNKEQLSTTVSLFEFSLSENYVPTMLTCRIQMFDLYDESTSKRIQPIPRRQSVKGASVVTAKHNLSVVDLNLVGEIQTSKNCCLQLKGGFKLHVLQLLSSCVIIVRLWL